MNAKQFRTLFMILHNTDRDALETSGIISQGRASDKDWSRFNNDLTTFVLKLSDDRVAKLAALVAGEMP